MKLFNIKETSITVISRSDQSSPLSTEKTEIDFVHIGEHNPFLHDILEESSTHHSKYVGLQLYENKILLEAPKEITYGGFEIYCL